MQHTPRLCDCTRLRKENEELRRRLEEADQTLQAIRCGEVDALVIEGPSGPLIYSISGAEHVYRVIVETMNEAALTVAPDGTVLFCNRQFAELVKTPIPDVIGRRLPSFVDSELADEVSAFLRQAQLAPTRKRFLLRSGDGYDIPAQFSGTRLATESGPCVCLVVTDLAQAEAAADFIRTLEAHQAELTSTQAQLADERELLQRMFDHIPVLLVVWDPELERFQLNRYAETVLGWTTADANAGDFMRKVYPDPEYRAQVEAFMQALDAGWREWIVMSKRGDAVPIEWANVRLTDQRLIGIGVDLRERKQAEQTLRAAVERYERQVRLFESVTSTTPDFVYIFDRDGRFLYANRRLLEVWGMELPAVVGRTCRELGYEQWHHDMHMREIAQVMATRAPIKGEVPFRAPRTGIYGVYEYIFTPVLGPSGEVELIAGTTRDVTERKQAEDALRASEALFRTVIRNYPNGAIYIFDRDLRFRVADGQALASLGYTREDLEGKTVQECLDPDTARILLARYPRVLAGESLHFETPLKGRVFSSDYVPVRDAQGEVVAGLVVSHDVTDLKTAGRKLERSESRFRLLSETAAQLLEAEDPQQVIESLARRVMEHLDCQAFFNFMPDERSERLKLNACAGVSPEEARAIEYLDFGAAVCGCVARDRRRIIVSDVLNSGDPRTGLVRRLGIQAYCCHPLIVQDRFIGTLSFGTRTRPTFTADEIELMRTVADQVAVALQRVQARAILERAVQDRTASLVQANRELEGRTRQLRVLAGELTMAEQRERKRLAQVLHDGLQQYIAAAKLQVAGLTGACGPEGGGTVEQIEQTLNEAIQMSRSLSADLSPPVLHRSGLAAALKWLARRMRDQHGLTVVCTLVDAPDLPEDVRVLTFESVRELLFNAAKHSGVSQAEIVMQAEAGSLRLTVSDAGAGFDPAAAIDADSGLGLFSIRERLALLGGTLAVDSAPGRGSRFTLTIPLPSTHVRAGAPGAEPKPIRVLLVDDHVLFRDGLVRLCKREPDLKVVGQAGTGAEAVALAREFKPDVILMDINMPGMTGIDATAAICAADPHVRVIGLSMYEDEHSMRAMRQAGAVDYISKGVAAAELIAAVRSCGSEPRGPGAADSHVRHQGD